MKFVLGLIPATAFAANVPEPTIRELISELKTVTKPWASGPVKKFHPDTRPSEYKLAGVLDGPIPDDIELNPSPRIAASDLPVSFDPREAWGDMCPSLNVITDQGTCASCWAMAGASAFSDRACIQTAGEITRNFSGEDLLECCSGCGQGCDGGWIQQTWSQLVSKGLVSGGLYQSEEGCKPYNIPACEHYNLHPDMEEPRPDCYDLEKSKTPKCVKECSNPAYGASYADDIIKLGSYYGITNHKVTDIMADLMANGPIETTFTIYEDFLTYTGGVYVHTTGRSKGGHAVKLMGWGVDEESGLDYWLVANSWNYDWGENGFFRVQKGVNMAGIEGSMYAGSMPGWSK